MVPTIRTFHDDERSSPYFRFSAVLTTAPVSCWSPRGVTGDMSFVEALLSAACFGHLSRNRRRRGLRIHVQYIGYSERSGASTSLVWVYSTGRIAREAREQRRYRAFKIPGRAYTILPEGLITVPRQLAVRYLRNFYCMLDNVTETSRKKHWGDGSGQIELYKYLIARIDLN